MNFIRDCQKGLIFDGAMGTMLLREGGETIKPLEGYNVEKPEVVAKIHRAYVEAGANVVTTNTFQANELRLRDSGYSVEEIIIGGVKVAKQAGAKYVALDIGPIGEVEPIGKVTYEEAYQIFKRQIMVGVGAGADCILMETFFHLKELEIALKAAKENCNLPVITTVTLQKEGKIMSGETLREVAKTLEALGTDGMGINCSYGPKEILEVLPSLLEVAKIPLLVQPNAGLPKKMEGNILYSIDPETFADYGKRMLEMGVRLLGGCCGTTPDYIRAIVDSGTFPIITSSMEGCKSSKEIKFIINS